MASGTQAPVNTAATGLPCWPESHRQRPFSVSAPAPGPEQALPDCGREGGRERVVEQTAMRTRSLEKKETCVIECLRENSLE